MESYNAHNFTYNDQSEPMINNWNFENLEDHMANGRIKFKFEWELEGGILAEVIFTQSFLPTDCTYTKPDPVDDTNNPGSDWYI